MMNMNGSFIIHQFFPTLIDGFRSRRIEFLFD